MKQLYFSIFLLLCYSYTLMAQDCEQPSATVDFQVNNCNVKVRSGELIFNDLQNSTHGFETPSDSGVHSVYALNTWIGGIGPDQQLKLAGGTYNANGFDFTTGPLSTVSPFTTSSETCNEHDRVLILYEYQSLRHLMYYNALNDPDSEVNDVFPFGYLIPEVFYDYPAHGNQSLNQAEYLAPFFDFNNDGIYQPEDGDCPLFSSMINGLD